MKERERMKQSCMIWKIIIPLVRDITLLVLIGLTKRVNRPN